MEFSNVQNEFPLLKLPPELQNHIWEGFCLPRRVIYPLVKDDHHTPWDTLRDRFLELDEHPGFKLRKYPSPTATRVQKINRGYGSMSVVWEEERLNYEERVRRLEGPVAASQINVSTSAWFDPKLDIVCLDFEAVYAEFNRQPYINAAQFHNDVLDVARDRQVPLMIRAEFFIHMRANEQLEENPQEFFHFFYERYIKNRQQIYVVLRHVKYFLDDEGRNEVLKSEMFGIFGEDSAIIPLEDKDMIKKYSELRRYDPRSFIPDYDDHIWTASRVPGTNYGPLRERQLIPYIPELPCSWREYLSATEDVYFKLQLSQFILREHGLDIPGREVVAQNWKLEDCPEAKDLGLKLPDLKPVCIFDILPALPKKQVI